MAHASRERRPPMPRVTLYSYTALADGVGGGLKLGITARGRHHRRFLLLLADDGASRPPIMRP